MRRNSDYRLTVLPLVEKNGLNSLQPLTDEHDPAVMRIALALESLDAKEPPISETSRAKKHLPINGGGLNQ